MLNTELSVLVVEHELGAETLSFDLKFEDLPYGIGPIDCDVVECVPAVVERFEHAMPFTGDRSRDVKSDPDGEAWKLIRSSPDVRQHTGNFGFHAPGALDAGGSLVLALWVLRIQVFCV